MSRSGGPVVTGDRAVYDQLSPIHRPAPRGAGRRSYARRHGDTRPSARGREPSSSRAWLPVARVHRLASRASGRTLMPVFRRNPRSVYRIYSEQGYLAGGDEPRDWPDSPERRLSRQHRLRRLAGLAALTGAVGTVGGVIVSAGVVGRGTGRQITARGPARTREVLSGETQRSSAVPPTPVRHLRRASRSRLVARRSPPGARSPVGRLEGSIHAPSAGSSPRMLADVPVPRANPVGSRAASVDGRLRGSSASASQNEFGFER
jgi:hypothetical protein